MVQRLASDSNDEENRLFILVHTAEKHVHVDWSPSFSAQQEAVAGPASLMSIRTVGVELYRSDR